ncbi:MAG TPA: hypothetical protein PLA71_00015 [Saccharofermentans sp.]|nr:hypothetical protein [Saccharofermentans sp.]
MYKAGHNHERDLIREIDAKNFDKKLRKYLNGDDPEKRLSKIIKNKTEFCAMMIAMDEKLESCLFNLCKLYPEIFTTHSIRYVRKEYINNVESMRSSIELMSL